MSSEADDRPLYYGPPVKYDEYKSPHTDSMPPLTFRVHDYGVGSVRMAPQDRKIVRLLVTLNAMCRIYSVLDSICEDAAFRVRKLYTLKVDEKLASLAAIYAAATSAGHGRLALEVLRRVAGTANYRKFLKLIRRVRSRIQWVKLATTLASAWPAALGLPDTVGILACRMIHVWRTIAQGHTPISVAASATYLSAKLLDYDVSQKKVAMGVVTDATIRNIYKTYVKRIVYKVNNKHTYIWEPHNKGQQLYTPSTVCNLAYGSELAEKPNPMTYTITLENGKTVIVGVIRCR